MLPAAAAADGTRDVRHVREIERLRAAGVFGKPSGYHLPLPAAEPGRVAERLV